MTIAPPYIPGISPQNGITDFFLYQMIAGKTQEITISGIGMMLVISNLSEIQYYINTSLIWLRDQVFKLLYNYVIIFGKYITNLIFWIYLKKSYTRKETEFNAVENDHPLPINMELNMSLKVIKNDARTQTDLLALVHYMMNIGIYVSHIKSI